MPYAHLLVGAG
uniref:Uncharacterized protein n=1 Tax=Arundo donax TaxID=35708 RepID=A0A0A9HS93_ARUDO